MTNTGPPRLPIQTSRCCLNQRCGGMLSSNTGVPSPLTPFENAARPDRGRRLGSLPPRPRRNARRSVESSRQEGNEAFISVAYREKELTLRGVFADSCCIGPTARSARNSRRLSSPCSRQPFMTYTLSLQDTHSSSLRIVTGNLSCITTISFARAVWLEKHAMQGTAPSYRNVTSMDPHPRRTTRGTAPPKLRDRL